MEKEKKTSLGFGRVVLRFVVYSLWAVGMAAVTLLPLALMMLDMDRLDLQRYVPLFYDKSFYNNMYTGFLTTYDMQGRDCKIGFSVIALISVFTLFLSCNKEKRQIKIEFLLMSFGLCIPFVGHVMNGFGYVANRWVWAYALLLAYIVTLELPTLKHLQVSKWLLLLGLCCIYIFAGYALFAANGDPFLVMSLVLVFFCLLLCLICRISQRRYEQLVVLITCISVTLPAYFQYSDKYRNYLSNFIPANQAYYRATNNGGLPLLNKVDASDGTRYNRNGLSLTRNASMLYGVSGMDFYLSYYNNNIDRFHNSIALKTSPWNFGYNGLDSRSELLALLGVNHFFTKSEDTRTPVTFGTIEAETTGRDGKIVSWTSENNYGLFSRFNNAVSYDDYYVLSPHDRQQLLMQAVAVDAEYADSKATSFSVPDTEVYYFIESVHDVEISGNALHVLKSGGFLTLRFAEAVENAETYLYFENIHFENGLSSSFNISAFSLDGETALEETVNEFRGLNNIHHMYGGKHNWILNLGDTRNTIDGIVIVFQNTGWYNLDGIHVYSDPISAVQDSMILLNQDVDHIQLSPNRYDVTLTCNSPEYLFAAIPHSDGWKAYDHGKPVQILNADVGFMALKLDTGNHEIRFSYHTPGLLAGFAVSVILISAYITIQRRRHSRDTV